MFAKNLVIAAIGNNKIKLPESICCIGGNGYLELLKFKLYCILPNTL